MWAVGNIAQVQRSTLPTDQPTISLNPLLLIRWEERKIHSRTLIISQELLSSEVSQFGEEKKPREKMCSILVLTYTRTCKKNFQTLLSNLFSFGNCLLGSKSSLAHLFKMTELFCLFLEIEMFSPQNLLDFVGFMQMTC